MIRITPLRRWCAVTIVVLLLCLLTAIGWRVHRNYSRQANLASLAAAINVYYQEFGALPDTLEPVRRQGCFGLEGLAIDSCGQATLDGRRLRYLKATQPGFVVVVATETSPSDRVYIVLGDPSTHVIDAQGLVGVLTTDESRRRACGQPSCWPAEDAD